MGQISCEREGGKKSQQSLEIALDVLKEGHLLGIYPEGTRSPDGRLYRGRTGVARLALTAGVPVIPTGLIGTPEVMPIEPIVEVIKEYHGELPMAAGGRFDLDEDEELARRVRAGADTFDEMLERLDSAFAIAKADSLSGVVIAIHANPRFERTTRNPPPQKIVMYRPAGLGVHDDRRGVRRRFAHRAVRVARARHGGGGVRLPGAGRPWRWR